MAGRVCNLCGKVLTPIDEKMSFRLHPPVGSKYYGKTISMYFCLPCFDNLIGRLKIITAVPPRVENK